MHLEYPSRIFARFNFLDKLMYPIAMKGIPIANILRIISILLFGIFSLTSYDDWDGTYITNVHIVILISVLYTFLIYIDDSRHFFNIFFIYGSIIAAISNIFVIANVGHSSDGMSRQSAIMAADMFSLFLLSFSLFSVRDKHFYANYLSETLVPNNRERIFTLTRSLKYGKGYFYDFEIANIISEISFLYAEEGFSVMSKRTQELATTYNKYIELYKSITARNSNSRVLSIEFQNLKELLDQAEYEQEKISDADS